MKKLILALVLVLIFLYIYVAQIYTVSPNITKCITAEEAIQYVSNGDLLVVSSLYTDVADSDRKFRGHFTRLFCNTEWSHVAVVVIIHGIPYVYDTCPWSNKHSPGYDFTLNNRKDSGFIQLGRYIKSLNGYIGIRKIKQPLDTSSLETICKQHNKHTHFSINITHFISALFKYIPLSKTNYKYSCVEAAAYIYEDLGIKSENFYKGMLLHPFVERHSTIFGDVVHVEPGVGCRDNSVIQKFNFFKTRN